LSSDEEYKPVLIYIHGYGSGGAVNYRIFDELSKHFHIFALDLLGMGDSGRPTFNIKDLNETEEFFIQSIKAWKEKVGITSKTYIAGHSLGGYVASIYALIYPEEVKRLLLISPGGVNGKPEF